MNDYRLVGKQSISINGLPMIGFHLYRRESGCFLHVGFFTVDAETEKTDAELIDAALQQQEEGEE
jgi:hypothetical protein